MSTQTLNGIAINNYPVFEGSQVLTSEQLNDLFNYLDQQNRYTRSKLIGIGVVCGLNVSAEVDSVNLSKGIGITSDGFLIRMPDCKMRYRRQYALPGGVFYDPFGDFDDDGVYSQDEDINLYELLSSVPSEGLYEEIDNDFLNDKYMLIYLECFDRDPRSCLGKNCEDLGKERIFTIRKLAVNQSGLIKILEKKDGTIGNPFFTSSSLKFIDLQKPLFQPDSVECASYEGFTNHYIDIIKGNENVENVFELLFGVGRNNGLLLQTYDEFEPVLNYAYNYKNPLTGNTRYSNVKSDIKEILGGSKDPQSYSIQYVYEYLCLLIQAYHEYAEMAELLASACSPVKEFSLHILLGKIKFDAEKEEDELDLLGLSRFRHQFLQPKIFNQQKELERKVISLHKRLVLMIESYDITKISNDNLPLKITPTETGGLLGNTSIPHYLLPDASGIAYGIQRTQLNREWNYELTTTSRKANRVISYQDNLLIAGESIPSMRNLIETPLFFNKKNYSYRVEGIFGKDVTTVAELENKQRDGFNLPYEILPIRFGGDPADILVENHYWLDLQSDYKQIKSGLIATIRNLLGELKSFYRIANEWEYDYPYANVYNFKVEIGIALEDITKSLGLCEEGERLLTSLPDTIEELYNNGSPTIPLRGYYKDYRRNLSKTFLRLEYATEILNWEKIEVLPEEVFHNWTKQVNLSKVAIRDFFGNNEFFQLFNLYQRFVNRYQYLQENHYSIFCNFLKQHPGIEQRPVDRGGTHVIVYNVEGSEGEESISNIVRAEFNLPYRLDEKEIRIPLDPSLDKIKLPPIARGEAVLITQGDTKLIDATANDLDPNGDTLKINRKGFTDNDGEFNSGKSFSGGDVIYHEGEKAIIRYETGRAAIGNDYFEYTVENNVDSTLKDNVVVEILVINPYLKHVNATDDLAATDNHHSVVIDLLTNDVAYSETNVIIPEVSEFGATLKLNGDKKVQYTPVNGREGKDSFSYELEHTREINGEEITEKSKATVNVIVYCCDKAEFELICEGNIGKFDVLTEREKEESAELILLDENGKPTDKIRTDNGVIRVEIDSGEDGDRPTEFSSGSYLEYTPDNYFTGIEEFTYEVIDKEGFIRRVKLQVLVNKCSETKLIRTLKDTPYDFSDYKGEIQSLKVFKDRAELKDEIKTQNGKVTVIRIVGLQYLKYEPDNGYFGLDTFQYAIESTDGIWHYNTLNVIVDGYEKVRVESTFQDNSALFNVISTEMLENGFSLKVFQIKPSFRDQIDTAEGGKATVNDGFIRYEPKTSFLGDDSFNYVILKNGFPFEFGRFHVIIDTNRKVSVEYTLRDTVKDLFMLSDEQIEKGATLTIVSDPVVLGATAKVENDDGVSFIRYSPADGYVGQDNFGYVIELDEVKLFGTVYMVIDSNERIEVQTVFKNSETDVVLFEKEQTIERFEIINEPTNGTTRWNADKKSLFYKPNPDFVGHDKVKYKASFGDSIQYGTIFFVVICECKDIQVVGTVTDETGNVIPDVRVQEVGTDTFALTGRSGVYNINVSPSSTLRFTKITHETEEIDVAYRTTVNAQLQRKRVIISGEVTSEKGDVLSNVVVTSELGSRTTDSNGKYEIETYANAPINYSLLGYLPQTRIAASTDSEINVQLIEGKVTLFITARDKEFGQILEGNVVEEVETGQKVVTDNSTKIVIGLSSTLRFTARGFQSKEFNVNDITFDATLEAELDILMDPAIIEVSGIVKNEAGLPVENASVLIAAQFATATDVEGRYQINLPLWSPISILSEAYQQSDQTYLIPRTSSPSINVNDTFITDANKAEVDFILKKSQSVVAGVVYRGNSATFLNGTKLEFGETSQTTEFRGEFNLLVPTGENLKVSASGYISQEIPITQKNEWLQIRMQDDIGKVVSWEEQSPLTQINNQSLMTSFGIGNKIYLIIGNSFNPNRPTSAIARFFEYDVKENNWRRKEDFPGSPRDFPVSFVVGNKAYVGLGRNFSEEFVDFWCFDPASDTWTKVADYPGEARVDVRGFTINNLGYVGTGLSRDGRPLNEFWVFDPDPKKKIKWTRQTDFPGDARQNASGFTINGVGYLGAGRNPSGLLTDLWSFTPQEGWARKPDMTNGMLPMGGQGNLGFAVGEEGFIAGAGYRNTGIIAYSAKTDKWERVTDIPYISEAGFAVVCNGIAYIGGIERQSDLIRLYEMK